MINSGCTTLADKVPVPNVEVCAEIPFLDGAEGACVETVTQKRRIVFAQEWSEQRPKKIMLSAQSWTEIKLSWLKACRLAMSDCNVQINSIETVIRQLDEIVRRTVEPKGKK